MATKNWALKTYSNSTWTDVVAEPAIVATLVLANQGGSTVSVDLRLEDAGTELAIILPPVDILAGESHVLDVRSLCVTGTQAIQMRATAAGVHVLASGVV